MKKFIIISALLLFSGFLCSCEKAVIVTFDPGEGGQPFSVTANAGKIPSVEFPMRDGCFFGGWWTEREGGRRWSFSDDFPYDGLTLYARWIKYLTVTFDLNLPEGQELSTPPIEAQPVAQGSRVIQPVVPELSGDEYYFYGWSKSRDSYQRWNFDKDTVTGDTVLYAHWKKYYVVTFDTGSVEPSQVSGFVPQKKVREWGRIELPSGLTAEGYIFEGWSESEEGFVLSSPYNVSGNVTLYARWQEAVKLTFRLNPPEGADVEWTMSTEYIIRKGGTLFDGLPIYFFPDPTDKNGMYVFDKWYYLDENGEEFEYTNFALTSDLEVYAKWILIV